MNNKLARQGANLAETAVIIVILILANWIGYRYNARLDMTATKQYTISSATKNVLSGLDDPVDAEFFLSNDLPPELVSIRDEIKDKLAEYTAYGKGKFRLKFTDPRDDEKIKERANGLGIAEQDFQVTKKDQMSVLKAFCGLALTYADKTEVLTIQDMLPESLEYALTSKLVRITQKEKPKVAFFEGSMNFNQEQGQQGPSYDALLNQVLGGAEGMYEVVKLDPQVDKVLPDAVKSVLVAGAFQMGDSLKYSIDQFLMNGGQVIIAIDPMMQAGGQMGQPSQAFPSLPTIEDQIEKYGVKFDKKLIGDSACADVQMRAGIFSIQQPYPLWPKIGPKGMNKDVAAISKLESVVIPWSCPLSDEARPGVKFKPLFSSSDEAFLINSPFTLDPQQDWKFLMSSSEKHGPFHVAYLLEGAIPSAFDAPPGADKTGDAQLFNAASHLREANGKGRLVVVSSAATFSDNMLQRYPENALFAANIMDSLVMGDELLGIRSAPVTSRPLKQLNDAQKSFIRWANVLGVPLLLVGFGLLMWFLRGQRRREIARKYAA
jgi:ABC-2 type transport system permease protein